MNLDKFYINGEWVQPASQNTLDVINPANEDVVATVASATKADVDKAVHAARSAFSSYSRTSREERLDILARILSGFKKRREDFSRVVSEDMGTPITVAWERQSTVGAIHLQNYIDILRQFQFTQSHGSSLVVREPIGVCGLITPWNWPLNQMVLKIAPALAAGCTVVLKPSEEAPRCANILAEVMHEAKVPAGVFNLVHGDGANAGAALSRNPDVDMVSLTGSTRAGILIAKAAADAVKRVTQELGGKSPNILLPDADFQSAVEWGVGMCLLNSGQTCNAPTRMFVPDDRLDEVCAIAKATAESAVVGDPADENTTMGPLVNRIQFDKVQHLVKRGIDEGAELVTGGFDRPAGLNRGYFVKPTIFARVLPEMTIAKEEIFGPVLSIISYTSVDEAIELANDTEYGLHGFVQSQSIEAARAVDAKLRVGQVTINNPQWDWNVPFGGYKRSGNGREGGVEGLQEFLEVKAVVGYEPA